MTGDTMKISKELKQQIEENQTQLQTRIRNHHVIYHALLKAPDNQDLQKQLQNEQQHIIVIGLEQKQYIDQLRKEYKIFQKTARANGTKAAIEEKRSNLTASLNRARKQIIVSRVPVSASTALISVPQLQQQQPPPQTAACSPSEESEPPSSVPVSPEPPACTTATFNPTPSPPAGHGQNPLMPQDMHQVDFMSYFSLATHETYREMRNKRAERKRRSTANPQFLYSRGWDISKRKRNHFYLANMSPPNTRQSVRNKAQQQQQQQQQQPSTSTHSTTALVPSNGHVAVKSKVGRGHSPPTAPTSAPPPTAAFTQQPAPPASRATVLTSPSAHAHLPLAPVPNIPAALPAMPAVINTATRRRSSSPRETKVSALSPSLPLSAKHQQVVIVVPPIGTTRSATLPGIPPLPSGLTIEPISDAAVACVECRLPGNLSVCEDCSHSFHIACHNRPLVQTPRTCPSCYSSTLQVASSPEPVSPSSISVNALEERLEEKSELIERNQELKEQMMQLQLRHSQLTVSLSDQEERRTAMLGNTRDTEQKIQTLLNFIATVQKPKQPERVNGNSGASMSPSPPLSSAASSSSASSSCKSEADELMDTIAMETSVICESAAHVHHSVLVGGNNSRRVSVASNVSDCVHSE